MATAAKNLFSDLRHGNSSSVRAGLSRTASHKVDESSETFLKAKEQEKHFIATWEAGSQKSPLPPNEVAKDPTQKQVGHSSKHLRCEDFTLLKTLGTGKLSTTRTSFAGLECVAPNLTVFLRHVCTSMASEAGQAPGGRRRQSLRSQDIAKSR